MSEESERRLQNVARYILAQPDLQKPIDGTEAVRLSIAINGGYVRLWLTKRLREAADAAPD